MRTECLFVVSECRFSHLFMTLDRNINKTLLKNLYAPWRMQMYYSSHVLLLTQSSFVDLLLPPSPQFNLLRYKGEKTCLNQTIHIPLTSAQAREGAPLPLVFISWSCLRKILNKKGFPISFNDYTSSIPNKSTSRVVSLANFIWNNILTSMIPKKYSVKHIFPNDCDNTDFVW
jgi:hypothetical protein